MTRRIFIAGLCGSLLAPAVLADDADEKAIAAAAKSLEGTWVITELEYDGRSAKGDALKPQPRKTYSKDGTSKNERDGTVTKEGFWKIVGVNGKVVHLNETPTNKKETVEAILEFIDRDSFRMCAAVPGGEKRPTKFEIPKGNRSLLLATYKRFKE